MAPRNPQRQARLMKTRPDYPEVTPEKPALDENLMKLSFGNNRELLKKSMEIYLRDAPSLMGSLKAAMIAAMNLV
jgi:hypothetical protein